MGQMIPYDSFRFCGGFAEAPAPIINAETCVNLYPEVEAPTAKGQIALIQRPGIGAPIQTLPGGNARAIFSFTSPTGPRMFAVAGSTFYEVAQGTYSLTSYGTMAGSTGLSPLIQMQPNGNQLLVLDASVGTVYNADPAGPVMTPVFSARAIEYLDGYYLAIATGSSLVGGNPNQISASAFLDGTNWLPGPGGTAAYALRTSSADLTIQLAVLNNQLGFSAKRRYLFGMMRALLTFA